MTIKIDFEGLGLMPRCQLSYAIAIKPFGKSQPERDLVDAQLRSHLVVITSRSLILVPWLRHARKNVGRKDNILPR